MRNLYIDFEYIEEKNKNNIHLICCVVYDYQQEQSFKFNLLQSSENLIQFLNSIDLNQTRFVGYAIALAEIPCLCKIMGRYWVSKTNWWDLWTEFKMLALTHEDYFTSKTGLASCLKILKIENLYEAEKDSTRDLILFSSEQLKIAEKSRKTRIETGQFHYSDEELAQVIDYCEQDVKILPEILKKLFQIYKKYPMQQAHLDQRGAHNLQCGISYFYQKGYPIDVEKLKIIFENRPKIKESLQLNCNQQIGFDIYEAQFKGPVKKKVFSHYQFNMKNFTEYVKSKGLYEDWKKTKTGLCLEEDYFDEMLSQYKDLLEPVYNARNTIKQLNSTNLADLLTHEGYIKSVSWPFNQKTSRTSPKPKMGFILNLTPWLRMLIKPKKGRAFVGIDFKSQEVLIAALISKDDSMLEDYLTDIYMGQAIKTGFAPIGSTKKSHPVLRDKFKPIVLGRIFGMEAESLSLRFFDLFKAQGVDKNLAQCVREAENFVSKLKQAYHKYYTFLSRHYIDCKNQGYYQTLDNWLYFVDRNTRQTQLVNVPCQSGGAAITRLAHDASVSIGIDVIQLHDALYFECDEQDATALARQVSQFMCDASAKILGSDHMSTETKIFTHECPYYDPRGEQIYRFIMQELNLDCPDKFNKPKEISNIHKINQ